MTTPKLVHLSDYGSQPIVRIACDHTWVTPAWGPRSGLTDVEEVYEADDDRLYTFVRGNATCEACVAASAPKPEPAHAYISTACHHALHDRCRKTCKFCNVACGCGCHEGGAT